MALEGSQADYRQIPTHFPEFMRRFEEIVLPIQRELFVTE
jgi:hypothetical protein